MQLVGLFYYFVYIYALAYEFEVVHYLAVLSL